MKIGQVNKNKNRSHENGKFQHLGKYFLRLNFIFLLFWYICNSSSTAILTNALWKQILSKKRWFLENMSPNRIRVQTISSTHMLSAKNKDAFYEINLTIFKITLAWDLICQHTKSGYLEEYMNSAVKLFQYTELNLLKALCSFMVIDFPNSFLRR